ncbi:MAG: translocation protein TolB, partial [Terriglobales bacterium]
RLALPLFAAGSNTPGDLSATFNSVLWNDLDQSAVVTMVGRSLYTTAAPTAESQLDNAAARAAWSQPPLAIQRLVFGQLTVQGKGLLVDAYLYNVLLPPGQGRLLARRYANPATDEGARSLAHHLADDIIATLGFGPGIASSQIAFISNRSGHQEVWTMDYDGHNQQRRTRLGAIAYSPRISPDGTKLAFMSSASGRHQIRILSLLTNKLLPFPSFKGDLNGTPAWSPDGGRLAFASDMNGSSEEIYTINANGSGLKRITFSHGYDNFAPAWNPKPAPGSPDQIAFASSRLGLPSIFTMNADGSNVQHLPIAGYAVSPSWSPNGTTLAFAWVRTGGGENSGASDIYLWFFGNQKYEQLTHNGNRNDFPSWAPDNRHIVFESGPPYHTQLYTVAADGSHPTELTSKGNNEMPNWSWH